MNSEYWQKQESGSPLFPDILWEKPERRDLAGKLLIVGGSAGGIHDVAQAFEVAKESGIGETRVLVPETLKKLLKVARDGDSKKNYIHSPVHRESIEKFVEEKLSGNR